MKTYRDILEHHGIKGQKWGVRRWQNKDGSLTKRGKEHYDVDGDYDAENNRKKSNKKLKVAVAVGMTAATAAAAGYYLSKHPEKVRQIKRSISNLSSKKVSQTDSKTVDTGHEKFKEMMAKMDAAKKMANGNLNENTRQNSLDRLSNIQRTQVQRTQIPRTEIQRTQIPGFPKPVASDPDKFKKIYREDDGAVYRLVKDSSGRVMKEKFTDYQKYYDFLRDNNLKDPLDMYKPKYGMKSRVKDEFD